MSTQLCLLKGYIVSKPNTSLNSCNVTYYLVSVSRERRYVNGLLLDDYYILVLTKIDKRSLRVQADNQKNNRTHIAFY